MNDEAATATAKPDGAARPYRASPPRRILVVDDEACIRLLLTEVLAGSGYDVDVAEDGAAAWEALQAKSYDLLITDHFMPRVTGLELIKHLRSARMDLPVVMAAGELPVREMARNPSLDLAATLLKPFTMDALIDTVKTCFAEPCPQPQS